MGEGKTVSISEEAMRAEALGCNQLSIKLPSHHSINHSWRITPLKTLSRVLSFETLMKDAHEKGDGNGVHHQILPVLSEPPGKLQMTSG